MFATSLTIYLCDTRELPEKMEKSALLVPLVPRYVIFQG